MSRKGLVVRAVDHERAFADRFEIVVDPDAESGDVLGALARLLIPLAQDGVLQEQVSEEPVTT